MLAYMSIGLMLDEILGFLNFIIVGDFDQNIKVLYLTSMFLCLLEWLIISLLIVNLF